MTDRTPDNASNGLLNRLLSRLLKGMPVWRTLAILCALALWVMSLWPADDLLRLGARYVNDKVGHFIGYMALAWLLSWGWPRLPGWLVWAAAFGCGAAIEIAQSFAPTREFSWLDMLANGSGALLGVLLAIPLWRYMTRMD